MTRSADALEEMKTLGIVEHDADDGTNGAKPPNGSSTLSVAEQIEAQEQVLAKISSAADKTAALVQEVRSQMREVDEKLRELDVRLAGYDVGGENG